MIEWPDHNRPWEWELYRPLVGNTMLELGNKRKGDIVYKDFFQSIGFKHTSVDLNGKDGALPLDLSKPLGLGTFDMVTNLGTSEHVSERIYPGQVQCWRNIVEALHVGSVLISITPQPGTWVNHGTWYPRLKFFTELANLNVWSWSGQRNVRGLHIIPVADWLLRDWCGWNSGLFRCRLRVTCSRITDRC